MGVSMSKEADTRHMKQLSKRIDEGLQNDKKLNDDVIKLLLLGDTRILLKF